MRDCRQNAERLNEILPDIADALGNAVERRAGALVLFHEPIPHPRSSLGSENSLEVNGSGPYFGKRMSGSVVHIFDVPKGEAAGMGLEELHRILAGLGSPVEVQLHLY